MTKPQRCAKGNRTQFNCTNCADAEVTNNKRLLLSRYCSLVLKLSTDGHDASRGLSATTELLVGLR